MTNLDIIRNLKEFFTTILSNGFVNVQKTSDITQMVVKGGGVKGHDTYLHFFHKVPMRIKNVCWISPMLASKNVKKLTEIHNFANNHYIEVKPCFSWLWRCFGRGSKYKIRAYDLTGKRIKSWSIRLFTINMMGNEKELNKSNNKDKENNP